MRPRTVDPRKSAIFDIQIKRSKDPKKILVGFEMRRDVATEALANAGWSDSEGKGGRGPSASTRARRTPLSAPALALRAK